MVEKRKAISRMTLFPLYSVTLCPQVIDDSQENIKTIPYMTNHLKFCQQCHAFFSREKMKKVTNKNILDPCKTSECFASQYNTKAVVTLFSCILQKYYQLIILGTLDMSGHFHRKQY